jgi:TPR repeat protein
MSSLVRRVSACIVTLGVMPLAANAELNRGREAYDRGEYVKAPAELSVPDTIYAPRATFLLGVMHANGQGVAQDRTKAIELFRQASTQGFAPADDALEAFG